MMVSFSIGQRALDCLCQHQEHVVDGEKGERLSRRLQPSRPDGMIAHISATSCANFVEAEDSWPRLVAYILMCSHALPSSCMLIECVCLASN